MLQCIFKKCNLDFIVILQYTNFLLLGNNVAPFCVNQTRALLSNLQAATRFYNNCAPVYASIEDQVVGDNDGWICRKLACYDFSRNMLVFVIFVLIATKIS